jgi:uncharacterized protein YjbI with pentapeptide repeats
LGCKTQSHFGRSLMIGASFAIVRPRVISPQSGEAMLLEDIVAVHLAADDHGVVELAGGPLAGKTTAIEYLDQIFADESRLSLVDEHALLRNRPNSLTGITVSTESAKHASSVLARYRLASWGRDEWIEYLLVAHKSHCNSVMGRLLAAKDARVLEGSPCLWRLVIDELAANESIASTTEALRRVVERLYAASDVSSAIRRFALVAAAPLENELDRETRAMAQLTIERHLIRLLALEPVRTILAASALVSQLAGDGLSHLRRALPYPLVREASLAVEAFPSLQQKLRGLLWVDHAPVTSLHPMAASLLHAAGVGWRPARNATAIVCKALEGFLPLPNLNSAYLQDVEWPGSDLRGAQLAGAKLNRANLENADLERANIAGADLSGARLAGASLVWLIGGFADFARADLSFVRAPHAVLSRSNLQEANLEGANLAEASLGGAILAGARFVRANLFGVQLTDCDITGADFTQANLQASSLNALDLTRACFEFAIFAKARLRKCNLEGMELPGADFEAADLRGAYLTGSIMPKANFQNADLRGAGLADVEWEGVDLRGADLREASFHLGSTRSGLVGSPYPSHGTRTGFYTDDYNEQDFKSPEEIRKANVRGADLRGAKIEGVDFYLVDVRDAQYDPQQEAHLRRCGAILKTRAV